MAVDLLFKKATVIDGTGGPRFLADVAVKGERIFQVGALKDMDAARVVEAEGLALAPGFVDMHGHSDYFLLILPTADGKLKQGITTEVGGNCGYSAAPVKGKIKEERAKSHRELYGLEVDWEEFPEYLERLEKKRPAINFAPLVGFNTVRASAGLYTARPPDPGEMDRMKGMLKHALAAGAFGMSLGLIYAPGMFARVEELAEAAKVAAEHGGLVASHMRSEGEALVEAVEESLEIARRSGVRFHLSHLKTSGPENWAKLDRVFELIEAAQGAGLELTADRYPYLASFTQLSAVFPGWVFEGGKEAFLKRLGDAETRERIKRELGETDPSGRRWRMIHISQVFHPGLRRYEGMSVEAAAQAAGEEPVEFVCGLVREAEDRVAATFHTMSEDNLARILKKEWVMVGSDAAVRTVEGKLSEGKPHPRAYGTMPRMLAWAVREKGWLSLETAVYKMTRLPCLTLGIQDRGLVKEGMFADLVLFDPEKVKDRADYDNPKQYPEGIEMVVVNGKVALERGELTGERAGKVLKRE